MIKKEQIMPGACYKFETGDRRVISVDNGQVQWIYSDGKKRSGKTGGYQKIKHFSKEAIEAYQDSVIDDIRSATRRALEFGVFSHPLFVTTYIVMSALIIYIFFGDLLFK